MGGVKLKHRPDDFAVVERLRPGVLSDRGAHALYRIEKTGLSTLEVAMRLAKAAGVRTEAVRFGGLKDRRARAVQHFSIEGGPPIEIDEPTLSVRAIGRAPQALRSDQIEGNDFDLVVRDLGPEEVASLARSLPEVGEHGLPNYFDDQRFGAARAGKGFPLRDLLLGNAEEALRLLVATPGSNDPPEVRGRKEGFRRNWGRFAACARAAVGWHERALFGHLARKPRDFRGALRFVPRRERLIQTFAFQSWIWNGCADRLVASLVSRERLGALSTDLGPLRFWRVPSEAERALLARVRLPLVGPGVEFEDASVRRIAETVLAEEGLSLGRLRGRGVRGMELRAEARDFVLRVPHLAADAPAPDEDHPGRRRVRLSLSLPRGAYATLVAKRLFAGSGEERGGDRSPPSECSD